MNKSQSKPKRNLLITVIAVIVIAVVLIAAIAITLTCRNAGADERETAAETDTEAPEISVKDELVLGDGITILSVTRYAGYYVEDGSNDIVSGIAAVRVRNDGVKSVQLLSFTLSDSHGQPYEFQITTLLPGQEMIALEKNRRAFNIDTEIVSLSVGNRAYFSTTPTLHPEQVRLMCMDNYIIVENISSETIPAGYVYYKNVSDDLWIGGITYRTAFRSLAPGEKETLTANHFIDSASRIVFVSYAEQ